MSAHGLFARLLRIPLVQFYLTIRSDKLVFAFHLHAMNICVSVWVLASGGEDGRFDLFDEFSRLWYACRRDIKDSGCVDNLTIGWVLQKFRRISTTRSLCINKQDST